MPQNNPFALARGKGLGYFAFKNQEQRPKMETAEKKGAKSKTRSSWRRSGPISRLTTGLKKRSGPKS